MRLVDARIRQINRDLNSVSESVLSSKTACARLQEEAARSMGSLKRQLNDILHIIKVNRQAFHGEVFVGNH